MSDNMNLIELSIDMILEEIKYDLEDGNYDPMIILGKSGVGKTVSIYELTKELGIGFREMRLVTMTETDIMGIPQIDKDGGTVYAANSLLPRAERDGERGILVLDEITSASRTVRASAYQLLDSKRSIGNYHLPDKWKIIALGNGPDDGGVFSGMEHAFLSRCVAYRVEPDLTAWKKWAIKNEVHPTILGFLSMCPDYLHKFDTDEMAAAFPCPRSWTMLSDKLKSREKRVRDGSGILDQDSVEIYAAGSVGAEVAPQFGTFYSYKKKALDTTKIIEGKEVNTNIMEYEAETVFIVIQSLIAELTKRIKGKNLEPGMKEYNEVLNVIRWAVNVGKQRVDYGLQIIQDLANGSNEFKLMIVLDFDNNIEKQCAGYKEFCDKAKIITS